MRKEKRRPAFVLLFLDDDDLQILVNLNIYFFKSNSIRK